MARRKPRYVHVGELKMKPQSYRRVKGRSRKVDHLWRVNREWFLEHGVTKESFDREVMDYQRRGASFDRAVAEWTHQEDFVSKEERGLRNIFKSLGPETRKELVEQMGGRVVAAKNGKTVYLNSDGGFFSFSKKFLENPQAKGSGWFWDDNEEAYVYQEDGNITNTMLEFDEDNDEEGGTPIMTGIARVKAK